MTLDKPYFVQISDMHLFEDPSARLWDVAPDPMLDRTLDMLVNEAPDPDFVLVTGDCSADGTAASYRRLTDKLRRLHAPVHYLPGNHDDPALLARLLIRCELPEDGKLKQLFEASGWRFILLDSVAAGTDVGRIGRPQCDWLRAALAAAPSLQTMVAVHHNPLPVGSEWLDTMTIEDGEALLAVIDAAPQVQFVLFGHVHQQFEVRRGHVTYLSVPSTFFQFAPGSKTFAQDAARSAGARVVGLSNGPTVETTVVRLDDTGIKAYRR